MRIGFHPEKLSRARFASRWQCSSPFYHAHALKTSHQLSASAEKRAIHEAWKHARKAQDAAKEAADAAMLAVEETARVQKFLDPHDVIKVEDETEMDVKKAELAAGTVSA